MEGLTFPNFILEWAAHWEKSDPEEATVEQLLEGLAEGGIETDAARFREEALRLGGAREVALEWWLRHPTALSYGLLRTYAVLLWQQILPEYMEAESTILSLFNVAMEEPEGGCSMWSWVALMLIGRLACLALIHRPKAPGEWLREAIQGTDYMDLLAFVRHVTERARAQSEIRMDADVASAWCPLLCAASSEEAEAPCWCGSGEVMGECCGRVERG